MNPCTSPVPVCSAPFLRPQVPRPRPLTGPEHAEHGRGLLRALRAMGDRVPRPRARGHWQDTIDPYDLGPLSDDRPGGA